MLKSGDLGKDLHVSTRVTLVHAWYQATADGEQGDAEEEADYDEGAAGSGGTAENDGQAA